MHGGSEITVTYTADGEKLTKISPAGTRSYISGIEYLGTALDAIYHAEGRCTPNGASAFYYEYTLKDHLGNARINFRANGTAVTFLQELHYYPFGLVMEGIGTAQVTNNGYKYNGKELNEDLGLNLSDYGARWYDAALGRWWSVDALAELTYDWTPYNYVQNMPIRAVDPDGNSCPDCEPRPEESTPCLCSSADASWPPAGGSKGDVHSDEDGGFVHDGKNWIDQGNGNRVLPEASVTAQGGSKSSSPKYTQEIPAGDGANWLTRATVATHSIDYQRDVSGLYAFADKAPEYWEHSLGAIFAAEGIVDIGFYLGRQGAIAFAAKNSTSLWPAASGGRTVINGIEYTTHALERMQPLGTILEGGEMFSRGIPPSVVENAIKYGRVTLGNTAKEVVRTFENVLVITNPAGTRVITVINKSH